MKPVPRCVYGVAETVTTEPLLLHGQQQPWKFDLSQDYRWMDLGADCPVGPCFTGDTYGEGLQTGSAALAIAYSSRVWTSSVPAHHVCGAAHTSWGETQHLGRARVEIPPGLNSTGSRVALGPAVGWDSQSRDAIDCSRYSVTPTCLPRQDPPIKKTRT